MTLWSINSFKEIGRVWGQVISFHEEILKDLSFERRKFKIITRCMDQINGVINLEYGNKLCPVRVMEIQEFKEGRTNGDWRCNLQYEGILPSIAS